MKNAFSGIQIKRWDSYDTILSLWFFQTDKITSPYWEDPLMYCVTVMSHETYIIHIYYIYLVTAKICSIYELNPHDHCSVLYTVLYSMWLQIWMIVSYECLTVTGWHFRGMALPYWGGTSCQSLLCTWRITMTVYVTFSSCWSSCA